MQFIDLAAQQKRIRKQIEERIGRVLDHGQYILGPEISELEEKLSDYIGTGHAISCASGTDALLLALMAYDVGPGDAVFTSPFTFIATAEVVSLLGATPVFVDIVHETFNIDTELLESTIQKVSEGILPELDAEKRVNRPLTPKGIIGVDLFGLPANYDEINAIAEKYGLFVIEDAAQSFGAEYKGKKAGCLAEVACTSFFPAKPFGCYGDGGMCFTSNADLARTMDSLRVHGKGANKYDNVRIGINGRMDTLQAAVLLAKFDIFPEEIELRAQVAGRYTQLLESVKGLTVPTLPDEMVSVWAQYSILAEDDTHRKRLTEELKKAGIPTAIYYPVPLHLQPAFAYLGYKNSDFPLSENCAKRVFSLPMHPYLSEKRQQQIAETLKS